MRVSGCFPSCGEKESPGEESGDLGKASIQTCDGCALLGTVLKVEEATSRPETSELSAVSTHIIGQECRGKS